MEKNIILSVKDLKVQFKLRGRTLTAVRGASLDLAEGETLAVVGESGCGKSVFMKSLTGMLDKNGSVTGGSILYDGEDLALFHTEKEWKTIRGRRISMVMQDPMTALNPLKKVGIQIKEAVELNRGLRGSAAKEEAVRLLEAVGISDAIRRYGQYPHEFSGGMRQRAVIAIAVACRPQILICDEPTTALDVTVQAQILELIGKLQKEFNMTIIYITHDLGVVAKVADRVAVMYAGQIVEIGRADEIYHDSWHPYSWALLGSLPQLGVKGEKLPAIEGTPPNLFKEIKGDAFAPRNKKALAIDFLEEPPFFEVSPTHKAKTWYLDPRAPEIDRPDSIARLHEIDGRREKPGRPLGEPPEKRSETPAAKMQDREVLVSVRNLQVAFGRGKSRFTAVSGVNFDIYKGETFSLVGESGSGKTTIGRALLRINPVSGGEILFKGQKINGKISKALDHKIIKSCQMIFQDPMASLNERAKVDYVISEGIRNFHMYRSEEEREQKVQAAIREVGLLPEFAQRFPHEFSGGQRQRIGIARTLIMEPEFVVADEPISALDVSIRAQILNLLNDMKKKRNLTYLFIAHDLSVVRFISDRIAVIRKGRIVELAEAEELFHNPLHPYTRSLLSAVPYPDPETERDRKILLYDPSVHDYRVDLPYWKEAAPEHFVWGNEREMEEYGRMIETQEQEAFYGM